MDGVKPRSDPMVLRRMIINTIPNFNGDEGGCRPYIQIFKNGKLLFTSTWRNAQEGTDIKSYYQSDGSFALQIDCVVQGDVLIRCRHLSERQERQSMFRAAFHTGYIPCGIQRLTKSQMDGACHDDRFAQDFFVDLIFSPLDAHQDDIDVPTSTTSECEGGEVSEDVSKVTDAGLSIKSQDQKAYNAMVEHSSSFWDEIAKRKVRASYVCLCLFLSRNRGRASFVAMKSDSSVSRGISVARGPFARFPQSVHRSLSQ